MFCDDCEPALDSNFTNWQNPYIVQSFEELQVIPWENKLAISVFWLSYNGLYNGQERIL